MLREYVLIAFRQLAKNKITSFINVTGLAIGIVTFTLLFFYVSKENSYDRYHDEAENIYRIILDLRVGTQTNSMAWTSGALVPNFQEQFKEITHGARLFRYRSPSVLLEKETTKSFSEENFIWADSSIFDVFTFGFVAGDPRKALQRPNTVVISESVSKKYFSNLNPIGKSLTNSTFGVDFEITGVMRDMPATSHFKADLICSLNTLPKLWGDQALTSWGNSFLYSYIKIAKDVDPLYLEKKINTLTQHFLPPSDQASYHFSLQPIANIHLHSQLQNEWQNNSNITYVYILTFVAILVLIVSAINYINLWIAQSEQRVKEIGIRQAIGSGKIQLASQFIVENLIHGMLALLLSVLLVQMLTPVIRNVLGEDLLLSQSEGLTIWSLTAAGVFLLMVIVALYPIQTVLRIKPALAIRGTAIKLGRGIGLWHCLIAFQIMVTTMLITGTLLIDRQLSFILDKPIGYDADRLLNISLLSSQSQQHYEQFKKELLQHANIKSVSACSHLVGGTLYQSGYVVYGKQGNEEVMWQRIHTDQDFCRTYGIPIVAGRDFSETIFADTASFIINETACRYLGLTDSDQAIGLEIGYNNGMRGKIIGVMKDFHFKTLHNAIEPLIIHIDPSRFRMLTVNVNQADLQSTIQWIKNKWESFDSSTPFVYTPLSDFNDKNYTFERKFRQLVIYFTLVVFLLSVTGLVSLTLYIMNLKRREIGIRKILGARIQDLLFSFSRRFAIITVIGFILSIPISWYWLTAWLSGFSYRVNLSTDVFIIAGIITFILSMLSITFPSIKAAASNPVDVLKEI